MKAVVISPLGSWLLDLVRLRDNRKPVKPQSMKSSVESRTECKNGLGDFPHRAGHSSLPGLKCDSVLHRQMLEIDIPTTVAIGTIRLSVPSTDGKRENCVVVQERRSIESVAIISIYW